MSHYHKNSITFSQGDLEFLFELVITTYPEADIEDYEIIIFDQKLYVRFPNMDQVWTLIPENNKWEVEPTYHYWEELDQDEKEFLLKQVGV